MHEYTAFMREAIEIARAGIKAGQSPFGAVIAARDGAIVARAHNRVRADCDATAHAEIVAIRAACHQLGIINLSGHVMATTCEPCPMCAAAIHWARLDAVIYGASIADAQRSQFNELSLSVQDVYEHGQSAVRVHPFIMRDECKALFDQWLAGPNPTPY